MLYPNYGIIGGNLTRDPELSATPSGTSVCRFGLAHNERRKDSDGEWYDYPSYFDITVWGAQGENCARFLEKGSPVLVQYRISQDRWENDEGENRQAVKLTAVPFGVTFLRMKDAQGADDEPEPEAKPKSKGKRGW